MLYKNMREREKALGETSREGERERKRERARVWGGGSGQGPFKREPNKCAQVLLLAKDKELAACQNPKSRPVEIPEY